MRSACESEAFYKEHGGKRYCVLHFPGEEKGTDFDSALRKKINHNDFNFQGVWFPQDVMFADFLSDFPHRGQNLFGVDFMGATFHGRASFEDVTFGTPVTFNAAIFEKEADFRGATFNDFAMFGVAKFSDWTSFRKASFRAEADFMNTNFSYTSFAHSNFYASASFENASFNERVNFRKCKFRGAADFNDATFNGAADFRSATFHGNANFKEATFKSMVRFAALDGEPTFESSSSLDLQFSKIDQPSNFSFHTIELHPHWFLNVDPRKFTFTHVNWGHGSIHDELESIARNGISARYRLLALTYRQLAVNAEENHRYREASDFRYKSMDILRKESVLGLAIWRLDWWYWLASGYGERAWQAALVLVLIWLLFAYIFFIGQRTGHWWQSRENNIQGTTVTAEIELAARPGLLSLGEALIYSASVMTLQKPEPSPTNKRAKAFVQLETVLGPLQAALLALAIRRKFMR
jgi:uncharacterized protein YjbI with pentapeptide repeats